MIDPETTAEAIQALGTALGELMEDGAPGALTLGPAPSRASVAALARTAEHIAILGRAIEVLVCLRG